MRRSLSIWNCRFDQIFFMNSSENVIPNIKLAVDLRIWTPLLYSLQKFDSIRNEIQTQNDWLESWAEFRLINNNNNNLMPRNDILVLTLQMNATSYSRYMITWFRRVICNRIYKYVRQQKYKYKMQGALRTAL